RCRCHPAIMVQRAVAEHFEILCLAFRRSARIGAVKGVGHAHAFDRRLLYTIHILWRGNSANFKDGWDNIDHVVELWANAADVFDWAGPGNTHALPGAPEVGRHLLGPLEWSVEGPRPGN